MYILVTHVCSNTDGRHVKTFCQSIKKNCREKEKVENKNINYCKAFSVIRKRKKSKITSQVAREEAKETFIFLQKLSANFHLSNLFLLVTLCSLKIRNWAV